MLEENPRISHAKRVYDALKSVLPPKQLADVVAVAGQVKKGGRLDLPAGLAFEFRSALTGLGLRSREHALGKGRVRFLFTAHHNVSDSHLDDLHALSELVSGKAKQAIDSNELKGFEKKLAAFTGPSMHELPNSPSAVQRKKVARQITFIKQHFPALYEQLTGKQPSEATKHEN